MRMARTIVKEKGSYNIRGRIEAPGDGISRLDIYTPAARSLISLMNPGGTQHNAGASSFYNPWS
jgi:hypothetical protein